jgi:aspartyl/asparaginyl beta-hydroxylase (cupin superfamily)
MTFLTTARLLAKGGKEDDAASMYEKALIDSPDRQTLVEAHGFLGGWHFYAGRYCEAIDHFMDCAQICPDQPNLEYDLGQALEKSGNHPKALEHYLTAIKLQPRNALFYLYAGCMLNLLGFHAKALDTWSLGSVLDPMLLKAASHPAADEDLKQKSTHADRALREHFTKLHKNTVGNKPSTKRVRDGVWPQTHNAEFSFANENQQPHFFYMRDLPEIAVFDHLDWFESLEKHWETIRNEFFAVSHDIIGKPYVHAAATLGPVWNSLKGSTRWRSIHLYQEGQPVKDIIRKFPKTCEALAEAPLVLMDGAPLEVFFSVLEPGTQIPPHFGLANCRLTCHLPLVIPDECGIRVNSIDYHWTEGEVFAFDDSFRHEAWNNSTQTRIVLIFETWAPSLTKDEQDAISTSYSSRSAWLKNRSAPSPDDIRTISGD